MEQAKKVLSGGLSLLHKTSEWYSSQLENVEIQLRSAQNIENNLDQSENQPINLSLNCNINMVQDLNSRLNHLLQIPNNNSIDQHQFDGKNQQNQHICSYISQHGFWGGVEETWSVSYIYH